MSDFNFDLFVSKPFKEAVPAAVSNKFFGAINALKKSRSEQQFEYYLEKSQIVRWYSAKVSSRKNADGKLSGYTIASRDITKRKEYEHALTQHQERLEVLVEDRTKELEAAHAKVIQQERLAVLGQLAASVAHEIRNPLGLCAPQSI